MKKILFFLLLCSINLFAQNGIKYEQISEDAVEKICNECDDADTRYDNPRILPGTNTVCWDILDVTTNMVIGKQNLDLSSLGAEYTITKTTDTIDVAGVDYRVMCTTLNKDGTGQTPVCDTLKIDCDPICFKDESSCVLIWGGGQSGMASHVGPVMEGCIDDLYVDNCTKEKKAYFVNTAVNGQICAAFLPGGVNFAATNTALIDEYNQMLADGCTNIRVEFWWYQGESDTALDRPYQYYDCITEMYNYYKSYFGDFNATVTQIYNGNSPVDSVALVNQSLLDFANSNPSVSMMSVDAGLISGDGIHPTPEGAKELTETFLANMCNDGCGTPINMPASFDPDNELPTESESAISITKCDNTELLSTDKVLTNAVLAIGSGWGVNYDNQLGCYTHDDDYYDAATDSYAGNSTQKNNVASGEDSRSLAGENQNVSGQHSLSGTGLNINNASIFSATLSGVNLDTRNGSHHLNGLGFNNYLDGGAFNTVLNASNSGVDVATGGDRYMGVILGDKNFIYDGNFSAIVNGSQGVINTTGLFNYMASPNMSNILGSGSHNFIGTSNRASINVTGASSANNSLLNCQDCEVTSTLSFASYNTGLGGINIKFIDGATDRPYYSTAWGSNVTMTNGYGLGGGNLIRANGDYNYLLGDDLEGNSIYTFVYGERNVRFANQSPNVGDVGADEHFIIAGGISSANGTGVDHNLLTMTKNGFTQINTHRKILSSPVANMTQAQATPQGALDVVSTEGAFIVPRMTTAQRLALPAIDGSVVYDITVGEFFFHESGGWTNNP